MTYTQNGQLNAFISAYITAMLWSTPGTTPDGEELESLEALELAPETVQRVVTECTGFYTTAFKVLSHLDESGLHSFELSGHDFWLTRNGHGVGFWDRGLGNAGDYLTALSQQAGEQYPYIGDDNLIYI